MQTIKHINEMCPSTMFEERLAKLHEGGPTSHSKIAWKIYYTIVISIIINVGIILIIITTITYLPKLDYLFN